MDSEKNLIGSSFGPTVDVCSRSFVLLFRLVLFMFLSLSQQTTAIITFVVALQGRTEFTPRFNPGQSSIRSLMTTDTLQHINSPPEIAYHPPDVLIPALHPPPGEVDVLNIVEAGLEFVSTLDPSLQYHPGYYDLLPPQSMPKSLELPPGKGIHLVSVAGDQFCDGTLNSWCHKGADDNCLLSGHNDGRNCLVFDGYSGWIKMVIPKVKYGYILLRLETWGASNANPATDTYTSVNNVTDASQQRVRRQRRLQRPVAPEFNGTILRRTNATATLYGNDDRDYRIDYDLMDSSVNTTSAGQRLSRRLKKKYVPPSFCDEFRFEYALDGTITSLNLEGFNSKKSQLQRVVEAVTILANKEYLQGKDEADIEFAFRIVGCRRIITFHLSHVYWA